MGGRRDLDQCIKAAGEGEGECYSIELEKEKELDRIQLEKEKERDRIQLQREKALIRIELEKKKFWRQMLEGYDELEAELRQRQRHDAMGRPHCRRRRSWLVIFLRHGRFFFFPLRHVERVNAEVPHTFGWPEAWPTPGPWEGGGI